ncbi:GDP-mannose transporter GONST1 isoform X1 [Canna indica]|uniref:GDP-mannose transporter GONST1 isoform X1 n=2 Tax=Magnoliopsida TaxID=3398 RepID=A0AAQ3L5N6_9LILI|nr:GDP-mannose transporter GONST1 isoform X1 [Canna indica]
MLDCMGASAVKDERGKTLWLTQPPPHDEGEYALLLQYNGHGAVGCGRLSHRHMTRLSMRFSITAKPSSLGLLLGRTESGQMATASVVFDLTFVDYSCSVMSSSFKLNLINYDIEESCAKDKPSVSKNAVYAILHSFLKQRNSSLIKIVGDIAGRTRLHKGNQAAASNVLDENGKHQDSFGKKYRPILSGIAYCISSCSMILLNKVALSTYGFSAGISLMLYQNFIAVIIVLALQLMGIVSTERLTWKLIRVWLPVNLIFVSMLVTGMYSLKYINVAMVTILKNMTNILTAIGEVYLFRRHQNRKVWTALFLMVISAVCGGFTDLSFHAVGYTWQAINCILTASYSLSLRKVMDTIKQSSASGSFSELSMVLLNNLLSIPLAVFLIILFNEWEYVYKAEVITMPMFWVVATASGLLGLAISFTSIWFLNQTGPTTYSLIGSLNKIPISIAGILLFKVPVNIPNFFSIIFGLFAGVFFAKAKMSR